MKVVNGVARRGVPRARHACAGARREASSWRHVCRNARESERPTQGRNSCPSSPSRASPSSRSPRLRDEPRERSHGATHPPRQEMLPQPRICPSWAEAHERTLASLNNGRPVYPVHWKGCVWLKRARGSKSSTATIYRPRSFTRASIGSRTIRFLTLRADAAPPTPPWSPAESRYCARTPRNSASRQSRNRSRRRERRFARACETRGSSP